MRYSSLAVLILGLCTFVQATVSATASDLRRTPIVKAVEAARPSVVNIRGEKTISASEAQARGETERRVNGMGTGVVIDNRGYIVTNHHVVDGVQTIEVTLHDKTVTVARLISYDPQTDLAVIKIDLDRPLPEITIGTSSDLMPGEPVIAVGNAYGYEHTVTRGIISALHRTVQVGEGQNYEDLIQTDASINPGNSGGPLLNIDGEMIGVNVAVRAGAQGIGFAIPADKAMAIAAELMSTRRLSQTWHGVVPSTKIAGKAPGLVVGGFEESSPAATTGLEPGDVIRKANGQEIDRPLDFERILLDHKQGDEVNLMVEREGRLHELSLTLATLPAEPAKQGQDPAWEVLGMQLKPIPQDKFRNYTTTYRGGMTVLDVRPNSPAARQGIRRGDVLVGMHVWETITQENVDYILARPDFARLDPLKFYILRGNETLFGHMTVSLTNQRVTRRTP